MRRDLDGDYVSKKTSIMTGLFCCSPYGTRTRVSTLKGWHPRPLDEGASTTLYRILLLGGYVKANSQVICTNFVFVHFGLLTTW